MNIYLPIEIKSREFESKLLLALEAAKRGHQVLLGPLSLVFTWGPNGLLKPGVFHDKALHPTVNYPNHKLIKDRGGVITTLDEESGLLDETYADFARMRFAEISLSVVSKVFCWGEFDSASLTDIYPNYKGIFQKSGSPRVDLWRTEFAEFYQRVKEIEGYSVVQDYILVVSNFAILFNQSRFWKLLQFSKINNNFSDFEQELKLFDHYAHEIKMVKEFMRLINKLSTEFPEKKIVIRPHPAEDTNGWKTLLASQKNIVVIREGSINQWVNGAKVVIHNGCTTAFEARVNGKPIIAFRPFQSELERSIPNALSHECNSIKEVVTSIKRCYEVTGNPFEYTEISHQLIDARLANNTGEFAYHKIVDAWEKLDAPALNESNNWTKIGARLQLSTTKKKFTKKIEAWSGQKDDHQKFYTHHKFESLESDEVLKNIEAFSLIDSDFSQVGVRKIFDKTFLLSK